MTDIDVALIDDQELFREGVRVSQLRPSDESLESVFSYLIAQ